MSDALDVKDLLEYEKYSLKGFILFHVVHKVYNGDYFTLNLGNL